MVCLSGLGRLLMVFGDDVAQQVVTHDGVQFRPVMGRGLGEQEAEVGITVVEAAAQVQDLAEAGAPAMPIGKDAAAYAAEQYAGTTALDSVTAEVDSELDEFPAHYEVELHTAWGEFEYLVDAYTGKVLSGQKDLPATAPVGDETAKPIAPTGDIGHAKAKSIALNHAGVSESKAYDMEIELDDEDGTLVYEVEFKFGGMEYSYEINAATGAILKHEAELDN